MKLICNWLPLFCAFHLNNNAYAFLLHPRSFVHQSIARNDDQPVLLQTKRRGGSDVVTQTRNAQYSHRTATCRQYSHEKLRGGDGQHQPPTLGRWITPALASALSYALYNIFIKLGSASIHPILGGVVLQLVATMLGTVMLLLTGKKSITCSRMGLFWSVAAGLAVGAAEILSFTISSMGVQASQSIPIMIGGSVAFGSVLGAILLREQLSVRGWLGVLLVVAGVVCVATDPKASLGH